MQARQEDFVDLAWFSGGQRGGWVGPVPIFAQIPVTDPVNLHSLCPITGSAWFLAQAQIMCKDIDAQLLLKSVCSDRHTTSQLCTPAALLPASWVRH